LEAALSIGRSLRKHRALGRFEGDSAAFDGLAANSRDDTVERA